MILIHLIVLRFMILDKFSHNICYREHNKSRGIRLKWEYGGRDISRSVIHLLGHSGSDYQFRVFSDKEASGVVVRLRFGIMGVSTGRIYTPN